MQWGENTPIPQQLGPFPYEFMDLIDDLKSYITEHDTHLKKKKERNRSQSAVDVLNKHLFRKSANKYT